MSKAIAKIFSQQFGTKVTLKSQQKGSMYGKKKVRSRKTGTRKNSKKY